MRNLIVVTISTLAVSCLAQAQDSTTRQTTPAQNVTAEQQGTSQHDTELTRNIRQELMKRDLSTAAKNVVIITNNGVVTLRGEVLNAAEKNTIGEIARNVAKDATVRNELTTKRQ